MNQTRDRFCRLMSAYCRFAGLADGAAPLLRGIPLMVNGIPFGFDWEKAAARDKLVIRADFGPVVQQDGTDVTGELLQFNMMLYPASGHALTVSPQTGHILLAATLPLTSASVEQLDTLLGGMSQLARSWQARSVAPDAGAASPTERPPLFRRPGDREKFGQQFDQAIFRRKPGRR